MSTPTKKESRPSPIIPPSPDELISKYENTFSSKTPEEILSNLAEISSRLSNISEQQAPILLLQLVEEKQKAEISIRQQIADNEQRTNHRLDEILEIRVWEKNMDKDNQTPVAGANAFYHDIKPILTEQNEFVSSNFDPKSALSIRVMAINMSLGAVSAKISPKS